MATNKGILDQSTFETLIKEDYWIKEITCATRGVDKNGNHLYWRTVSYPIEYYVTPEQIETAKKEYQRRRREELDNLQPGEIAFVAMGMDFYDGEKIENSPNNHRIRCYFYNKYGHKYFIELTSTMDCKSYYVDFSVDADLEEKREKEHSFIQDYYNACGLARSARIPTTWDAIINLINKNYKCNYTTGKLFKYFISPDDYICRSK